MWEKKIVEQKTGEKWVRERKQRSCGAGIEEHLAGKSVQLYWHGFSLPSHLWGLGCP